MLANYVTNALKYSADDAQVTVGLKVTEGLAVVWVRDEGPGLAWEEQTRIWELFHRALGVTTKSHIGGVTGSLGLGLHICKQVIEMHPGGRVGVDSTIGDGSTFWFRLPIAANW